MGRRDRVVSGTAEAIFVRLCVSRPNWKFDRAGLRHRRGRRRPGAVRVIARANRNLDHAGLRHRCGRWGPGAVRVIARANRNLDRAGPRHCCSRDDSAAMRVIARPKVVQEDNALARDRDNQGYQCAASVHVRHCRYLTAAEVVRIAAFDDQLAFTMSGGASVGPNLIKASRPACF
jgi:hypothetical protein